VETSSESSGILAQALDDEGGFLGDNSDGLEEDHQNQSQQSEKYNYQGFSSP
jgi:hypothetical protein